MFKKKTILPALLVPAFDGGEDIGKIVAELRNTNDRLEQKMKSLGNNEEVANLKGKIDALNDKLDKSETKSNELAAVIEAKKGTESETLEKMTKIEKQLARMGRGTEEVEQKVNELKYLEAFAKNGFTATSDGEVILKGLGNLPFGEAERKQYLRSDDNAEGGFLMEHSFENTILKPITEISPVRQLAASRRINALSTTHFTRDSLLTFSENGEGITDWTPSNSTYGKQKIPVNAIQGKVEVTNRALLGSRFNLEQEINSDFIEAQAELQNRRFVTGDGAGRPKGFMKAPNVPTIDSGIANSFNFDNLVTLTAEFKTGYNPMYAMNRRTLAFIRTLKDDAGNYIWRAGNLGAGVPNQINGFNYTSDMIDMDDIGAGKEPVILADFRRFYMVVDAFQAIFIRNQYRKDGYVIFTIESFYGGDVIMPEAGVKLVCQA